MKNQMITTEKQDSIIILKFVNREKLNPLDIETGKELLSILKETERESAIRAVLITGKGRAFSAGGDVAGMEESIDSGEPDKYMYDLTKVLYDIGLTLKKYSRPVVAAVNGLAVGAGMNLALCCDFIFASHEARFAQSFCKLALIPGFGGTHLLINQLTWQRAAEIAFLGEMIDAEEMHKLGLVNRVVQNDLLLNEAIDFTKRLAEGPTLAYSRTKELFLEALGSDFETHIKKERKVQVESARTDDYSAGVKAILKKEKPLFKGK